jgi:hypothetical protein
MPEVMDRGHDYPDDVRGLSGRYRQDMEGLTMFRVLMVLGFTFVLGQTVPAVASEATDDRSASTTVTIRVDGDTTHAREMLQKLQGRGARRGITFVEGADHYDLRVLVLARGPQWHDVIGIAASGAVAVLGPTGDLLFMHIRQKEATAGGTMDRLVDAILGRLPALLRGDRLL